MIHVYIGKHLKQIKEQQTLRRSDEKKKLKKNRLTLAR